MSGGGRDPSDYSQVSTSLSYALRLTLQLRNLQPNRPSFSASWIHSSCYGARDPSQPRMKLGDGLEDTGPLEWKGVGTAILRPSSLSLMASVGKDGNPREMFSRSAPA